MNAEDQIYEGSDNLVTLADYKTLDPNVINNINSYKGYFTENRGQIGNSDVRYYIQGKDIWFMDNSVVIGISEQEDSILSIGDHIDSIEPDNLIDTPTMRSVEMVFIELKFINSNEVLLKGNSKLDHKSNFFYGNVPSQWCTDIPNYNELIFINLYDNIDLKYYFNEEGLKYDFIVHPGGNPGEIKIGLKGPQEFFIDSNGDLNIKTEFGNLVDSGLCIYQDNGEDKNIINGKFNIIDPHTFNFDITGIYDKNKDLVIDPLVYSTFMGGSGFEINYGIAVDTNGNSYVTGYTMSVDFPNTTGANDTTFNGIQDAFVLKLNPTGSNIVYSTYIGGSKLEYGYDIVLDTSNNVYITGYTSSDDFPTTPGAFSTTKNNSYDIYVLKLNQSGSKILFSTFVGGNSIDYSYDIELNTNGNAYITGRTSSNDFPTTKGAYDRTYNGASMDVFVFKLNSTGTGLVYSTYLGGSKSDWGWGIDIDSSGYAYVTGETYSVDFPNSTSAFDRTYSGGGWTDAFVTKLNGNGSQLIYSTFIGGTGIDKGREIEVDGTGNAYVTGSTSSSDFPITTGAYDTNVNNGDDIFAIKLNSTGSKLLYSTFIGGEKSDRSEDLVIDSGGNTYITGYTNSPDFPNTTNAEDRTFNGGSVDVFTLKLNYNGSSLLYSTFLGGGTGDSSYGIDMDKFENVYVCGSTHSPEFQNTSGAYDNTYNGGGDAFIFKLNFTPNSRPSVLDLEISQNMILRTNSIDLYANASDLEDAEKNLTPIFEYRDQNENSWNNTYFSNQNYMNSRWEVSFTPPANTLCGQYDFRILVADKQMKTSSWLYLNNSLTVLNNIPVIEDLKISKNQCIQNDIVFIHFNGSDVDGSEENLTIEVLYRDPNDINWNSTHLNTPAYTIDKWEIVFLPPTGVLYGYYDFKARFRDIENDHTKWIFANDSLLVYNSKPDVVGLSHSSNSVFRTTTVQIFANGSDIETSEASLEPSFQYRSPSGGWRELPGESFLSNYWQVEFTPRKDAELGIYDLRVNFNDTNGDSSDWLVIQDTLTVNNNLPTISSSCDDLMVGIDPAFIDLTIHESDIEDTNESLTWSIDQSSVNTALFTINIDDILKDILKIIPVENNYGSDDISLILTDKDGGVTTKSDVTISVDSRINDTPPELPEITLISPAHESILTLLQPTFEWSINYSGTEKITYTLLLDEKSDPGTQIVSAIEETSYIMKNDLINGKTYYWKVNPSKGSCISSPFSFTISIPEEDTYKVNLTSDKNIVSMKQAGSVDIDLTVKNIGNIEDSYSIELLSNDLITFINIDKSSVTLGPGLTETISLNIKLPDFFDPGDFDIIVTAISVNDKDIFDELMIKVKIEALDFIPNYAVSISTINDSIVIEPGRSGILILNIINLGNIKDEYTISHESRVFKNEYIDFSVLSFSIGANNSTSIKATIKTTLAIRPGEYPIKFMISSPFSSNSTDIMVKIQFNTDDLEPDPKDPKEEGNQLLVGISVAVVIAIMILLLLYLLFIKKKGKNEESGAAEPPVEITQQTQVVEDKIDQTQLQEKQNMSAVQVQQQEPQQYAEQQPHQIKDQDDVY